MLSLSTPTKELYMVGPTYAKRLNKLNIETAEDLLHHYPFRYDDFSLISTINQLQLGKVVTIQGEIISCQNIYTKYGKKLQKAVVADQTGQIEAIWFNQPFLTRTLKEGLPISLAGKVDWFDRKPALISPEYELIRTRYPVIPSGARNLMKRIYGAARLDPSSRSVGTQDDSGWNTIHTGRLVPVYPETYGVSSKWLRSRIAPLIEKLIPKTPDWLPQEIKEENNLIDLRLALKEIHFPNSQSEISEAKSRLSFDELFLIQLEALKRKQNWQKNKLTHAFFVNQGKVLELINSLPFSLTNSQNKALKQILDDLKLKKPMNRLLEGDVGSGKTVVAAISMYVAYLNGLKSALMAPTEILAQQHYQTIKTLLEPFGLKVNLITGSHKSLNTKYQILNTNIIIGTHALIYDKVKLDNLGLVIIDEQHRFGVEQRAKLINKGKSPHILTMTATPIPRTIALTLYGDLDLSVLDEMPPARKEIKTWVVPLEKRLSAYHWISKQIKKERCQIFIVCPLIEQSDKESMKDIRAATVEFERLSKKIFPDFKLGLLHGQMKTKDKDKIINDFRDEKLDILVSTPVIEVGIDIPNATIMMIEGADRFGLAQLHQLRGRVGRSNKQSYCLLFTSTKDKENRKRLAAMQKYISGFKLAEIDLQLRGAGEIYGTQQHGFANLKIASFTDNVLMEKTSIAAKKIIPQLNQFPLLQEKLKTYTIKLIEPN